MMKVPAKVGRQCFFMVTANGDFATFFWSRTFWKEDGLNQLQANPQTDGTMTAEKKNGIRQPQAMELLCGCVQVCRATKIRLAMMKPIGAPSCGNVP